MVQRHLRRRGVNDERVLRAMATVAREQFVPHELAEFAYGDHALPIAEGQTISQPFIVAAMTDALEPKPGDRVLEVGTGSGYGAAVLGQVADEVWTIERLDALASEAERRLRGLGYDNVNVVVGDGTVGHPDAAPYDAISVTAGGPNVPPALLDQLADGGRLVIPVGAAERAQQLLRIRRRGDDFQCDNLGPVRFVPLVGEQGWSRASV